MSLSRAHKLSMLGVSGCARLAIRKAFPAAKMSARAAKFPLMCRPTSSDKMVFTQIFLENEYAPLAGCTNVELSIDCGANVGYSSAWMLSTFPTAKLIAVEPDPHNAAVLRQNLAPYGNRARVVEAGVWSSSGRLVLREEMLGNGREWARQVRLARDGEPESFPAVDIATLFAESGCQEISILKIDIEGAEVEVLTNGDRSWMDKVRNFAIELHDDTPFGDSRGPFAESFAAEFDMVESGELTVGFRKARSGD
jgi:FkbM family methyltransferase